jgi:hypothetical protein
MVPELVGAIHCVLRERCSLPAFRVPSRAAESAAAVAIAGYGVSRGAVLVLAHLPRGACFGTSYIYLRVLVMLSVQSVWPPVQSSPTGSEVILGSSPEGSFEAEMLRFMQVRSLCTSGLQCIAGHARLCCLRYVQS